MRTLDEAYAEIELPWFPAAASVTILQGTETVTIVAGDPEDQAMVAAVLRTAVSGYGDR